MKLTKILATALVALVAMTAAVSAADPACVIDLTNEANLANFSGATRVDVSYDAEKGATVFAPNGSDPYVSYNLPAEQQFDCAANTWCKIGYETAGDIGGIQTQFFWNTTTVSGPSGGNQVDWYRDEDGKYVDQVFEMLSTNEGGWDGTLTLLRLDPFQDEDNWGDEELFVKYIAFFASEADAQAYTFAPAAAAPTTPDEPATGETTTTPETGAAQTADMASVAVIGLVAAAAVVVASKKR